MLVGVSDTAVWTERRNAAGERGAYPVRNGYGSAESVHAGAEPYPFRLAAAAGSGNTAALRSGILREVHAAAVGNVPDNGEDRVR